MDSNNRLDAEDAEYMRVEIDRLKAENSQLRAALEAAPLSLQKWDYEDWFDGPRAEALRKAKAE